MAARICVAIRASTTASAVAAAVRAAKWADLIEIRADYIQDLDLHLLFREKPRPLIFTLRAPDEGGEYRGLESRRLETIIKAAAGGADYVDVEFSANWKVVLEKAPKERVILSFHTYESTPAGLETKLDRMAATDAGIVKIVTRARSLADNIRIARLLNYASVLRKDVVAIAMGREGIPSRILGPHWGSWMTFASLPGGESTAEGQLSAEEMVNKFRVHRIGFDTRLYGVLGKPLGHSLSPLIHNAAFAARGMNAVFMPLEASSVDDFLEFEETCRLHGASVTIPYKEQVSGRTNGLSTAACSVGAVNTLVKTERGWHGENTDVDGFLRPVQQRMHLSGMRAAVLGSGGAARAAVYGLSSQGASVSVVARNETKGRSLAEKFGVEYTPWAQLRNIRWDLLVNATPVGMYPEIEQSPVPADWLSGDWVYDLVYNPGETRLLKDAARRGCKTIEGAEMFLGQALQQQQLWFGSQGPEKVMREALLQALGMTGSED